MANRISLFSKWLLIIVVFQIICIIGLSVGSEDADLGISSSKLKGSSEDLKSDFNFELERQSPAGSLNSKLKTSEELKLKKNGNLLENNENDEYIVQDNESEDDGYIVQDNESENEYIVQDDESEDDGYIVQDEKNDLDLKLQSKISFKSTSDVHTPDDNRVQSTKSVDDSNGIPTGRKDVYHYGNASPKTQSSGKRPEVSGSSDDGKIHGVDSTQPPKKSELSTWEKAQIMMMKRNKNKMEKDTKQKADEILVSTPIISPEAETPNFVSEKSLGVEHSDSSQRIERSEDIDFPQFDNLSLVSNDVVIGDSVIEESREKSIEQPISIAKEDRHESMITAGTGSDGDTLKGDSDNYLENIKDTDKEVPHQDWDSEINATEASLIEETHQSKNIKSSQSKSAGIIDHEAGDGISEDNIDKSQGNDEDQDNDDAGDQESDDVGIESDDVGIESDDIGIESDDVGIESDDVGIESDDVGIESDDVGMDSDDVGIESDDVGIESDTDIENVKEVKNEMYIAENRDSVDSNVISSAKDYFEDEIINSSNSKEVGTHNLMNESINDIKDDGDLKPTTSIEKSGVEEFNMARDVLTRDGLKVDGEHVHMAEGASDGDITANDTDGYQAKDTEDIDEMETDSDNNVYKNMDDKESETVGRDIVSTAGNVALFDEVTLDSHRERPDDPSANDQTNLDKDDSLVIIEDVIKEDDVETSEEINKDTQSGNSVLNDKNSSEFNEDAYDDDNDIKQDYENGAKQDNKDGDEGTRASDSPIKDVNGNSDSDKIDGKEIDEYTKNIETKEDNMDIVEDEDDEKLMDDESSEDLDNDTGNDEDVEAGGDIVEGDMDEKEDVGNDYESVEKDDENVVNDATEVFVEEGDEKGSRDDDAENVDEDDEKLNGDSMDRNKNIGNDDESIEQVHKNILKEEEDNEDVVKDGDEEIDSKDSDENTENVEVIRDKEDVEEDNKQVVDKLPSSEDKGISDDNKSTKNNDENVNRGGEKGPKDAEKYTENEVSEVSRDIDKDDEVEKEILADEPSKDEDEDISDVDDFEGIKKDDISVTKNDEVIAKDNNNDGDDVRIVEDINEKDNKTSPIGYVLDTNGMVNETISDHTTTRNATHFEQINTQKMPKDDSYGEGITAKKAQADEDDWTGTDVIAEGKMLKKDVINGGDAPGLTFEDVPTYVEINTDRDEQGTEAKADIDDGSINVGVVDAGHPVASNPTPASSHEADPSKNDATAESEEMPIEAHEKDSETSVKDNNLENFDVSIDKDDSLMEGSDLETSFSREAEKESAMDKDLSNGIAEVDKDISDAIEAIESSNVESEEVMPDSTADKNDDEVCPNIAGERKAISTPEAQDKVGKEGSEELELKSPIESDEKNLDEIPQEVPREPTGQFLSDTSEDVEAEAEIQSAGHDSYFPDIPVQEENLKITPEVEDEKVTENKRVVENEKADEDEQLTGDGEKVAAAEDVKGDGKVEEIEKFFQDTTLQSTKRDWVFFTIKPYFTLLKTVVKKLDPFVTGIIFMLPPSLQNIFLKAPFNMYPTHAFLLFTLSCLSLFVISFSKIFKGSRWHSKSKELKEMLFEMKGVLLLSQVERDEAEKKLQDLKAKLKQKDDDLESGTVEMNRNLKALIKECDTLKEEVSRRMGSSKEMKSETKKAESDIQKQSLVNKELQESIVLAKNHIQQLQDKRDQLQSSIDESELNSMKLEEKIQCLSEDVGAVEESHDRLRTEVESKEKESVELQTAVDFLKQKCSKKSGDIQTKEKENKILREAIVQLKIMKHIREEDESDDDGSDDDKKKERLEERIKHLIYIAQMRSRMDEIEEEKESLKKSLAGAAEKKMDLNDELKRTMEEIEKVGQLREDAEHQATASTMKIDVLSDYYKQREKEYNKMLQEKEAKEKAISSQKKSANERYKEVDKMVADYKNQVEVLNQELERIGIHYEKQMALQENKLQENLVFVKQTERDYNIKVKEAEIMRQKLLQYRDRINLLESMMASHKSTETLNTSQTKEDIRPASRNVLLRENMPSPPNFMPPSFSPHPSSLGPNPPQFFNPHPFLLRHPFIPPRLPMRSREDSPTLQRFRDLPSEDFLDERGHYPTLRNRSPLRFGPSPASRNRSSPSDLKEKYTPMTNNRPLDPFYMEKGDGSHRTSNDK